MDDNEMERIHQCQQGNLQAFEEIVELYEKKIYNLAYRMMGNHEDANDMTQEAFIRAYQALDTFRGDARFSTWLYRIATNVCLDELRKKSRRRTESLDQPIYTDDGAVSREIPDWSTNPDEALSKHQIQEMVWKGIQMLPDDQKNVLILRDIQGHSYEEIADITQVSLGTVKSRLNRARLALKDIMEFDRELFFFGSVKRDEGGGLNG